MIIHITTVHQRMDTRIRLKQTATLARVLDTEVKLFVQDGLGDEWVEDGCLLIHDTGKRSENRIARMTLGAWRMFNAVRKARPTIAHFHDPELIPWSMLIRLLGIRVVYDVHEDLPRQIVSKNYIPALARRPLAFAVGLVERFGSLFFDAIATATPSITERFPEDKTVCVQNFPLPAEFSSMSTSPQSERSKKFAYVGGISEIRGTRQMLQAIDMLPGEGVRLEMRGKFMPTEHQNQMQKEPGWARVNFAGWASRPEVADLFEGVRAGLVLYLPVPNHINAQPNKLFEYMAGGLPVIASDFPLWRQIVETEKCGLLADPNDPIAISKAMRWIFDNPQEAEEMGRRGRQAVENRYNWDAEAEKLVDLYHRRFAIPLKEDALSEAP